MIKQYKIAIVSILLFIIIANLSYLYYLDIQQEDNHQLIINLRDEIIETELLDNCGNWCESIKGNETRLIIANIEKVNDGCYKCYCDGKLFDYLNYVAIGLELNNFDCYSIREYEGKAGGGRA